MEVGKRSCQGGADKTQLGLTGHFGARYFSIVSRVLFAGVLAHVLLGRTNTDCREMCSWVAVVQANDEVRALETCRCIGKVF